MRANQSLDDVRASFMTEVNLRLPRFKDGAPNPSRGDIAYAIESVPALGTKTPMSARDAQAILSLYAAANARLAREWNGGAAFFDDRIDGEDAAEEPLEVSQVIDVAAHLWVRQQQKIRRLQREIAALRRDPAA